MPLEVGKEISRMYTSFSKIFEKADRIEIGR